jgi:hypothetical protein
MCTVTEPRILQENVVHYALISHLDPKLPWTDQDPTRVARVFTAVSLFLTQSLQR